jgi:hypothetical protein
VPSPRPEDIDIGDDATADQSIAKPAEGVLDRAAIQKRICLAHATSNS